MSGGSGIRMRIFRNAVYLLVGIGIGVGAERVWRDERLSLRAGSLAGHDEAQPAAVGEAEVRCLTELSNARIRIDELSKSCSAATPAPVATSVQVGSEAREAEAVKSTRGSPEAVSWRVSAIEKFVPITDEQRERLRQMFTAGGDAGAEGSETLEDIIGAESAAFYRQQVQSAFKRAQEESVEKEIVWISRQLGLNSADEQRVRQVFTAVEQQLAEERRSLQSKASSPRERVKLMMDENRRRRELRNEQLKAVMSPAQYESFLQSQADSTESDIEIFHGAG